MQTAPPAALIILNLPFPPKECSPNYRPPSDRHYEKARATKGYKEECRKLVRSAMVALPGPFPLPTPVTAVVTFILTSKQRRDLDNLLASFKAGLDGIVAAGVLADDDCWSLRIAMEVALGTHQGVSVRLEGASS